MAVFALVGWGSSGCADTSSNGGSDAGGAGADNSVTISRATFKGAWPFTVSSGVLRCEPVDVITFTADGTTYAVNGTARDHGIPNVTPIWKRDPHPTFHGQRVYLGDVNARGQRLCGG